MFRAKYRDGLERLRREGKLVYLGESAGLADDASWRKWLDEVLAQNWVVYAKRPFAGPDRVLKYLSRYTHRVAISNARIVNIDEQADEVSFTYKDYRGSKGAKGTVDNGKGKPTRRVMKLDVMEFLRRFLQHVLPKGVRAYPPLWDRRQPQPQGETRAGAAGAWRGHPDRAGSKRRVGAVGDGRERTAAREAHRPALSVLRLNTLAHRQHDPPATAQPIAMSSPSATSKISRAPSARTRRLVPASGHAALRPQSAASRFTSPDLPRQSPHDGATTSRLPRHRVICPAPPTVSAAFQALQALAPARILG